VRAIGLAERWAKRQLFICVRDRNALQRPERALIGCLTADVAASPTARG
jgi:hypothetical protein